MVKWNSVPVECLISHNMTTAPCALKPIISDHKGSSSRGSQVDLQVQQRSAHLCWVWKGQQCVPARLNDHTDCEMKLSPNQITLVQSLVLLVPASWMNDGSHALQNECVCVSLGWMHTVSNINYVTWCTGAYWRVCLAYPFHRAERVSEWTERRDGVENS